MSKPKKITSKPRSEKLLQQLEQLADNASNYSVLEFFRKKHNLESQILAEISTPMLTSNQSNAYNNLISTI